MEGYAFRTVGDINIRENKVSAGLKNFSTTVKLAEKVENQFLKASTLHRVAKAYLLMNQPDAALTHLLENIQVAKQFGYSDELEVALKLTAEVYASKEIVDKAYEYQSHYIRLHDSLFDQRNSEHLAMMQARFESKLKQDEI